MLYYTVFFAAIAAVVGIDQLTKLIVASRFEVGESAEFIKGILRWTYVQNRGAAFGMLASHRWIFILLSTLTVIGLTVYMCVRPPKNKWLTAAMALVIGGGIGNMIDRVRLGYVIDMVDFCAFPELWRWVFNFADACVCVGAAILVLVMLQDTIKESREEKKAKGGNGDTNA